MSKSIIKSKSMINTARGELRASPDFYDGVLNNLASATRRVLEQAEVFDHPHCRDTYDSIFHGSATKSICLAMSASMVAYIDDNPTNKDIQKAHDTLMKKCMKMHLNVIEDMVSGITEEPVIIAVFELVINAARIASNDVTVRVEDVHKETDIIH